MEECSQEEQSRWNRGVWRGDLLLDENKGRRKEKVQYNRITTNKLKKSYWEAQFLTSHHCRTKEGVLAIEVFIHQAARRSGSRCVGKHSWPCQQVQARPRLYPLPQTTHTWFFIKSLSCLSWVASSKNPMNSRNETYHTGTTHQRGQKLRGRWNIPAAVQCSQWAVCLDTRLPGNLSFHPLTLR